MKSPLLLLKNQWKFTKKHGIRKELIRIWKIVFRPMTDVIFGREFKEKAREDLEIIRKILEQKNVNFFLIWGTCIGAVREGNFIAWDDDIDIATIDRISPEIKEEIRRELILQGFKIDTFENYQECTRIICKRKTITGIHWFQREGAHFVWREGTGELATKVPSYLFDKLSEAYLGEEKFLVPDPPEVYLDKLYPGWRKPNRRQKAVLFVEE